MTAVVSYESKYSNFKNEFQWNRLDRVRFTTKVQICPILATLK